MKVLVVDDEPLARQRLEQILSRIEQVSSVITASNGKQAIEICQAESPDIVLLDIRMPGIDGLETAHHLCSMAQTPAIIFTTAYDEYALEAFQVHAVDYLLKPVRQEKLAESISRASKISHMQLQSVQQEPKARTNIAAKISGNIKLIPVAEVLYFQADQKYVTVKHIAGETIIEDTLKELQNEFAEDFIRVHRNALVAKQYISGIHKDGNGHTYVLISQSDDRVEISRRHLSSVKKLITTM